ncbi:hypothetical protein SH528x_003034 [Novipirellula sp. SH528]|uniref:hypothetical protein n=1 Tax=Novipirellula sp. SH528 TaxID=3454466 RepID=UPI003FA02229
MIFPFRSRRIAPLIQFKIYNYQFTLFNFSIRAIVTATKRNPSVQLHASTIITKSQQGRHAVAHGVSRGLRNEPRMKAPKGATGMTDAIG